MDLNNRQLLIMLGTLAIVGAIIGVVVAVVASAVSR